MMRRYFDKDRLLPIPRRIGLRTRLRGRGVGIAFVDSGFHPHPDLCWPNRIVAYHDFTRSGVELFGPPNLHSWHGLQTSVVGAGNGRLSGGYYRSCAPASHVALLKVKDRGPIRQNHLLDAIFWLLREGRVHGIRIAVFTVSVDRSKDPFGCIDAGVEALLRAGICVVAAAGNADGTPLLPPASSISAITVGGYVDDNSPNARRFTRYPGPAGPDKPEILAPAAYIPTPLHPAHPLFLQTPLIWELLALTDTELRCEFARRYRFLGLPPNSRRLSASAIRATLRARLYSEKLISAYYQHGDGTSFAAPIAASVIACLLEAQPRLRPWDIKAILTETATPHPVLGALINPRAALRAVAGKRARPRLAGRAVE